jgi:integrase
MNKDEVLKWLERRELVSTSRARYSIQTKKRVFRVSMETTQSLAKRLDSETIRSGFASACKKAEITCGQTKAGGITWHDLRHTFATSLRGERVHELDIMQLLGTLVTWSNGWLCSWDANRNPKCGRQTR